jgi:hypothetical protein
MLTARRLTVVFAVLATSLLLSFRVESAGRVDPIGHQDGNHCVNASGADLNDLYGVSEQFRTFECRVVSAGEHWIRPIWWITNTAAGSDYPLVYPVGYAPMLAEPIDDFVAKLTAVRVVIDGGTPQERSYTFDASGIVRTDIDAEELDPGAWGGVPYPMASIMLRLHPLSVGEHFVEAYIVLSAQHCDGFATDPDFSCVPAGETQFIGHPVEFTLPEH